MEPWQPIVGLTCIACLLVIILVPMSFGDVEYNEMAFTRSKISGTVDTSKVYFAGRHYIGVTANFKKFFTSQFLVPYNRIVVFNNEKLEITMSCSLQFILRPEDLRLLHDLYDVRYKPIIVATANAAIKGAAAKYKMDHYRLNRTMVAKGLRSAIELALDGNCCRKHCTINLCRPGCKPYGQCKDNEKGLFTTVTGFQLKHVELNYEQTKIYVRTVLEQELKDTELFTQREKITRKQTSLEKAEIDNTAKEVFENATATGMLLMARSASTSTAIVANAQNQGLSIIHKKLDMKNETHKSTLDYVRTIRNMKDGNLYIGFQYMVAKP